MVKFPTSSHYVNFSPRSQDPSPLQHLPSHQSCFLSASCLCVDEDPAAGHALFLQLQQSITDTSSAWGASRLCSEVLCSWARTRQGRAGVLLHLWLPRRVRHPKAGAAGQLCSSYKRTRTLRTARLILAPLTTHGGPRASGAPATAAARFVPVSQPSSWACSCGIRVWDRDRGWQRGSCSLPCPRLSYLEGL